MDLLTYLLATKRASSMIEEALSTGGSGSELSNGAMSYCGTVDYYTDLPSNASAGDCYIVKYQGTSGNILNKVLYVYSNNSEWISAGNTTILDDNGNSVINVETAQPDWDQNDSTAADYVKNRPFYITNEISSEDILFKEFSTPGWFARLEGVTLSIWFLDTTFAYGEAICCLNVVPNMPQLQEDISYTMQFSDGTTIPSISKRKQVTYFLNRTKTHSKEAWLNFSTAYQYTANAIVVDFAYGILVQFLDGDNEGSTFYFSRYEEVQESHTYRIMHRPYVIIYHKLSNDFIDSTDIIQNVAKPVLSSAIYSWQSMLNASLNTKADKSELNNKADKTALSSKADYSALASKIDWNNVIDYPQSSDYQHVVTSGGIAYALEDLRSDFLSELSAMQTTITALQSRITTLESQVAALMSGQSLSGIQLDNEGNILSGSIEDGWWVINNPSVSVIDGIITSTSSSIQSNVSDGDLIVNDPNVQVDSDGILTANTLSVNVADNLLNI